MVALALAPLAIARCRSIGVIPMTDDRGEDDKIITVRVDDPQFADFHGITELPRHTLSERERFFLDYKVLERKQVLIEALRGHADAEATILTAIELYRTNADRLRPPR